MKVLLADDTAERAGACAGSRAAARGLPAMELRAGEASADAVAAQAPEFARAGLAIRDRKGDAR